jgi:hypothetical protein
MVISPRNRQVWQNFLINAVAPKGCFANDNDDDDDDDDDDDGESVIKFIKW